MKSFTFLVCLLLCLTVRSATVTFTLTNSLGVPDTNGIKIFPIAPYINADGSVQTTGRPFVINPNSSGFVSTNLAQGNYLATNQFIVNNYFGPGNFGTSQGIIFAVPNNSSTYPFGLLAISGYNVFNYNGIGSAATNTFSVGVGTNIFVQTNNNSFTLQVPTQSFLTNGLASTNYVGQNYYPTSNPSGFVPATITNNFATINYVNTATNGFTDKSITNNLATKTYVNAATNGFTDPSITNGFATLDYVNTATNGFIGRSITNNFATIPFVQNATNGFTDKTITNVLATQSYVQNATNGFTDKSTTNGLATIAFVQAITNGFVGTGVTNGLATVSYVQTATNGFTDKSVTNGLSTVAYVQAQTNLIGQSSGLFAYQPTNSRPTFNDVTNIALIFSGVASNAIASNNGLGTNTTITNGMSLAATNIVVMGGQNGSGGLGSGTITFSHGDTIREYGSSGGANGDTGITIGISNGPPVYENLTFISGGFNDVGATLSGPVTAGTIFGAHNIIGSAGGGVLNGSFSTIAGGVWNTASGNYGFVSGGISNSINPGQSASWVGGASAIAVNSGTFVWNDFTSPLTTVPFLSVQTNTFIAHALNGFGFNTNNPGPYTVNVYGNVNSTNFFLNGTNILTLLATSSNTNGLATTNYVGLNFIPNLNGFATNANLASNITLGVFPTFVYDTNEIGIFNATFAGANGTYVTNGVAGVWTNIAGNGMAIVFQNPTYFVQNSQTNIYSTTNPLPGSTWLLVAGSTTVPSQSGYGILGRVNGIKLVGLNAQGLVGIVPMLSLDTTKVLTNNETAQTFIDTNDVNTNIFGGAITVLGNIVQEGGSSALGVNSHAEGNGSTAAGNFSHAEGFGNSANGSSAHVEGNNNVAGGQASHAEGTGNTANGNFSFAGGQNATAGFVNSFTWSDSANFSAPAGRTFNVSALGGINLRGGPIAGNGLMITNLTESNPVTAFAGPMLTTNPVNGLIVASYNGGALTNIQLGNVNVGQATNDSNGRPLSSLVSTNAATLVHNNQMLQGASSYIEPLTSFNWYPDSAAQFLRTYRTNEFYVNENNIPNSFYTYYLMQPVGTTNTTISLTMRAISGTASPNIQIWNKAGTEITNIPTSLTTAWSTFTFSFTNTLNVILAFPNNVQAFSVSNNMTVTYFPTPTDPVLSQPFRQYTVLRQNLDDDCGGFELLNQNNGFAPAVPDPTTRTSSTGSYLEFDTSASSVTLSIYSFGIQNSAPVSVYAEAGSGMIWITNIFPTLNTNLYTPYNVQLPATQGNTRVRVYNAFAAQANGADGVVCQIYVPVTNGVSFVKTRPNRRLMITGDSIVSCKTSPAGGLINDAFHLIEQAFPVEIYRYAESGGTLFNIFSQSGGGYNQQLSTMDAIAEVDPSDIFNEMLFNDWALNTYGGTNAFAVAAGQFVDAEHNYCPRATIYYMYALTNTSPGLGLNGSGQGTNAAGNTYQQYCDAIKGMTASRTGYCIGLNAFSWLTPSDLFDGVHPSDAGYIKMVSNIMQAIWYNRLTVQPNVLPYQRFPSNTFSIFSITNGAGIQNGTFFQSNSNGVGLWTFLMSNSIVAPITHVP